MPARKIGKAKAAQAPGDAKLIETQEIAREKAAQSPEDLGAMSPEKTQQLLHELTVHQIQLEMQNEELRRTQAELEDTRARYFDLYDLAPEGFITINEQGLILEANLTAANLLGVNRGALANQPIFRLILKEDQDIYYLFRKQLMKSREPQACELRMVKQDGTVFWGHLDATIALNTESKPVQSILLSDITERKLHEEKLRESEAKFRATISQSMDGILIADGDSRIIEWNDAQTAIFGYSREEMLGKQMWEFQYSTRPDEEKTPARLQTLGERMLDSKVSPSSELRRSRLEYVVQAKDGQRKTIDAGFFVVF